MGGLMADGKRRLGGWWRLWVVVSALWVVPIASFAVATADYRSVEDYRLDRLTTSCTTYENGQTFLLNRVYTEDRLRRTYKEGTHAGEAWWPDLERCIRAYDVDYITAKHDAMVSHFTPLIMVTLLLPVLSLILGLCFSWVVKGFRRHTT